MNQKNQKQRKNEKGDFLELYKSSKGFEKLLLILCLACTCAIPFTLLALKIELTIGLWIVALITIFIYKMLRKKRTKQKIEISILPRIDI